MRNAESDKMGIRKIGVTFQRGQRHAALAQHSGSIAAGGEDPFRQHAVHGVELAVQDFLPQV